MLDNFLLRIDSHWESYDELHFMQGETPLHFVFEDFRRGYYYV
jgi:hypothetical protein